MAKEKGREVDMEGFDRGMEKQKSRSRAAASVDTHDWIQRVEGHQEDTRFLGYESLEAEARVIKYRKASNKGKDIYHVVLDQTPFYAESGGQVGDRGHLLAGGEKFPVTDTRKENNLTIHVMPKIPAEWPEKVTAVVDGEKRKLTENNHTATHLLHSALKTVLGSHVQQKGSLVDDSRLRFDFSHFGKMSPEEIYAVESLVNEKVRENISMQEHRELSMEEAEKMGAVALFGEKYGEKVRVVAFDDKFSSELCGGTHVQATGQIGLFTIVSEGAIAAGIRRVEAVTGKTAEEHLRARREELQALHELLDQPKNSVKALTQLLEQHQSMKKQLISLQQQQLSRQVDELVREAENIDGINYIATRVDLDAKAAKDLAFQLKGRIGNLFLVIAHLADNKPGITIMISENLVKEKGFHAGNLVRELAQHIKGGGGGQPFFATAGGKDPGGLDKALQESRKLVTG